VTIDLVAKYDRRVPRYTSYPTAPHFHPSVDAVTYRRWLGSLSPSTNLSLYLHVPFCRALCWFCGCHTKATQRAAPIARYAELLGREIDLIADALPSRLTVSHIHWGGGSPTLLPAEEFSRLSARLREKFDLAADAGIAIEIDPRTATQPMIAALAANGVNRASLGIQDFDQRVQEAINRVQSYATTERVARWLRAAGIQAINLDLLYGLPHQTVDTVAATVRQALALAPARIALFGYAHVPWMKKNQSQIDEKALPSAAERVAQFTAAQEILQTAGYVPVGLDHFARADDGMAQSLASGTLRRNFQGYTTDIADALIGLGASAIGALPQGYVQNAADTAAWSRAIADGHLATVRGIRLSDDDRVRRTIIERLMCDMAVDLDAIARGHGFTARDFAAEIAATAPMVADGLVVVDGAAIRITEAGRPYSRVVCALFDRYLNSAQQRHAKAL